MNEIQEFCLQYAYPAEAVSALAESWERLKANEEAYKVFLQQTEVYKNDMNFDYHPVFDALHSLEEATGISKYTIDLLFILQLMPLLKAHYIEKGYPLSYYEGFAGNLPGYLIDCRNHYGVWGTSIGWWLVAFFKLKCFTIGRCQYKPKVFKEAQGNEAFPLPAGQAYLDIHIPPAGPLTPELCHASYAEAAEFFRKYFGYTEVIITASSWLLSPDLETMLPANSNILKFAHDFTLLEVRDDTDGHTLSFFTNLTALPEDLNDLPEDSSLQRAIKAHLMAGNKLKTGFGVLRVE